MAIIFQAKRHDKIMAIPFTVFSWILLLITAIGLQNAEGGLLIILLSGAIFPVLMVAVSALRLAVIFSRKVYIENDSLVHKQVFKNHTIPLKDITSLQYITGLDNKVSTLRIMWSGPRLYLDRGTLQDYHSFVGKLMDWVPENRQQEVEGFEAPETEAQNASESKTS